MGRRRKLWESLEVSAEVDSPCTGACSLDPGGRCELCGRTIAEIAAWLDASNEEKAAIVRAARSRRGASA